MVGANSEAETSLQVGESSSDLLLVIILGGEKGVLEQKSERKGKK
jgi:hypothetical protein